MTRKAPHLQSQRQNITSIASAVNMVTSNEIKAATQECSAELKIPSIPFRTDPDLNPLPPPDLLLRLSRDLEFHATTLAAGLSSGCSFHAVKDYLQSYPREMVDEKVDSLVKGYKLLTYAVHSDSAMSVQLLLEYGASLDLEDFSKVPLLARAIMQTKRTVHNSTELVKVLLAHGADPDCIPNDMWSDYIEQPNKTCPSNIKIKTEALWCMQKHRLVLAETLHLTHRYHLWRASRLEKPARRMKQVAKAHKVQLLFGLPFMMTGQSHAAKLVVDAVFSEIAFPTSKPLVLAFAGPSGHGKTELATQMGHLLNVPWVDIDCAQTSTEFGLLGSTSGYTSNAEGSKLNNFLAAQANKRCVVFLDEFDKTTDKVREVLLKVTDTGLYQDRRPGGVTVDTSKCIWIMASNLGDSAIEQFYFKNMADRNDEEAGKVSIQPLKPEIEREFRESYSPAVTGRINSIVPFFPFSTDEQAVVAHKFLLALQDEARLNINLKADPPKCFGHCDVSILDDGKLCQHIAKIGYTHQQGARSIDNTVYKTRQKFVMKYLATDVEVAEAANEGPLDKYTVQLHPDVGNGGEVVVFRDGATSVEEK